jgi:beta-lactamase class A
MKLLALLVVLCTAVTAQTVQVPKYYIQDPALSDSLLEYVRAAGLDYTFDVGEDGVEQISLAVIDLNSTPLSSFGGVRWDNFIYPASVYKMYIAAGVLTQVFTGNYPLTRQVIVAPHNAVDRSREILSDPRPLLQPGDTVTVNYLLDLMITRSDNSAANCLIDVATRDSINTLLRDFGWKGSEVTRKFLKRQLEDPGYDTVRGTETCALHAADFLHRVAINRLVCPWVSQQLKVLLGRQLDSTKLAAGLPPDVMFYHKTGWYSCWTNDVGIVDDGTVQYVIACFVPLPEDLARPRMKSLSAKIYNLMRARRLQSRS